MRYIFILLLYPFFIFAQLTPCQLAVENASGLIGEFVPQCEEDGSYSPMQCWSSTGYCWCVDENGIEIVGTAMPPWQGLPDCATSSACDLIPDPGNCDAAFLVYFFNQITSECQETTWGGCGGVVPFWTLEECESMCGSQVVVGCLDPSACNYNPNAIEEDGSCQYAEEYYDCEGNCLNDIDGDNICNEYDFDSEDCLNLNILSINQINPSEIIVSIQNTSWDNIFSYPGFILYNTWGDTIAMETVDYYGIGDVSTHTLLTNGSAIISGDVVLELYTDFYNNFACEWNNLVVSDNCDLTPNPGPCFGFVETYFFNSETSQCETTFWGLCGGVVPFWTLEECQNSCEFINLHETGNDKEVIRQLDILGRSQYLNKGIVINLYNDGSVDKTFILEK